MAAWSRTRYASESMGSEGPSESVGFEIRPGPRSLSLLHLDRVAMDKPPHLAEPQFLHLEKGYTSLAHTAR